MANQNAATKHLIDSLEQRMAQLRRVDPASIVVGLGPLRLNRLVEELPGYIDFLQNLQTAAQQQQRANRSHRSS